jgi:hypothetical protein
MKSLFAFRGKGARPSAALVAHRSAPQLSHCTDRAAGWMIKDSCFCSWQGSTASRPAVGIKRPGLEADQSPSIRICATIPLLRRLRHVLSSLVRRPRSWVRIPLRPWMFSVCVCALFCVCVQVEALRQLITRPRSPTDCV